LKNKKTAKKRTSIRYQQELVKTAETTSSRIDLYYMELKNDFT